MGKKIKVLIVDDSVFMQQYIARALAGEPRIEVVAFASDPFDASEKIISSEPDVLVLDINMPRMDGVEFLKKLLPQYPLPVIVISSNATLKGEALVAGAVDFVAKPKPDGQALFLQTLRTKIMLAPNSFIAQTSGIQKLAAKETTARALKTKIIAIGASTGGTEATSTILKQLGADLPCIVIVQHMPEGFTKMYADRLDEQCAAKVSEAKDGDPVEAGRIYIAPGMFHMKLVNEGGNYRIRVFQGERVNSHCPSVDVMFDSAADLYRKNAMGILLTGMGEDGARGLLRMRENGAFTVAQDEKSSVVYGMPKVAVRLGAAQMQASPTEIPKLIYEWVNQSGTTVS